MKRYGSVIIYSLFFWWSPLFLMHLLDMICQMSQVFCLLNFMYKFHSWWVCFHFSAPSRPCGAPVARKRPARFSRLRDSKPEQYWQIFSHNLLSPEELKNPTYLKLTAGEIWSCFTIFGVFCRHPTPIFHIFPSTHPLRGCWGSLGAGLTAQLKLMLWDPLEAAMLNLVE